MDPLGVVVDDGVREKPPEVAFAENDHVIQELAPTGSDPSGDRAKKLRSGTASKYASIRQRDVGGKRSRYGGRSCAL